MACVPTLIRILHTKENWAWTGTQGESNQSPTPLAAAIWRAAHLDDIREAVFLKFGKTAPHKCLTHDKYASKNMHVVRAAKKVHLILPDATASVFAAFATSKEDPLKIFNNNATVVRIATDSSPPEVHGEVVKLVELTGDLLLAKHIPPVYGSGLAPGFSPQVLLTTANTPSLMYDPAMGANGAAMAVMVADGPVALVFTPGHVLSEEEKLRVVELQPGDVIYWWGDMRLHFEMRTYLYDTRCSRHPKTALGQSRINTPRHVAFCLQFGTVDSKHPAFHFDTDDSTPIKKEKLAVKVSGGGSGAGGGGGGGVNTRGGKNTVTVYGGAGGSKDILSGVH
jgi:hypothetical protein